MCSKCTAYTFDIWDLTSICSLHLNAFVSFSTDVDYTALQHSEALCGATDAKHYMREREVEHSVTLDLLPPPLEHLVPCRSVLTATGSNGFIVRLHRSKSQSKHSSVAASRNMDNTMSVRNNTRSCPLSIVSIQSSHSPCTNVII